VLIMDSHLRRRSADLDSALEIYLAEQRRLVRIADRVVHDPGEAADIVQEVWLRWQHTNRQVVDNPQAFLVTATRRLAVNVTQSARHRRESSIALWPHAMVAVGPDAAVERRAAADLIIRSLLAHTNPQERAAYLLRHGFGYPYQAIAELLDLSAANSRQLVHRATLRIRTATPRPVQPGARRRLVQAFVAASQDGDLAGLEAVLAADITADKAAEIAADITRDSPTEAAVGN
jgi:RNA polymerase sigma-70 factor (ECF subfamily)